MAALTGLKVLARDWDLTRPPCIAFEKAAGRRHGIACFEFDPSPPLRVLGPPRPSARAVLCDARCPCPVASTCLSPMDRGVSDMRWLDVTALVAHLNVGEQPTGIHRYSLELCNALFGPESGF